MQFIFSVFLSLLISFFSTQCFAQTNALLWEISGNGLANSSYLFGTIHTQDKRAFEFSKSFHVAFNKCIQFACEVPMENETSEHMINQILNPKGVTLKSLMPDSIYNELIKKIKKRVKSSTEILNTIKPIVLASLFSESFLKKDMSLILDSYLEKMAVKKQMKVISLENKEEAFDAFSFFSLEEQSQILIECVLNEEKTKNESIKLIDYYHAQQLDSIWTSVNQPPYNKGFNYALFDKRNIKMVENLINQISYSSTFAAVGIGHFIGENGMISLLKAKGYLVKPIKD